MTRRNRSRQTDAPHSTNRIARPIILITAIAAVTLFSGCSPGISQDAPPGYAIVYAVSDYASISDLGQPDDDAIAIAAMLEQEGYTIISGGPRTNADANMANLLADFATVRAIAEPGSRFFFYFAGHGYGNGMESNYGSVPFSEAWATYLASQSAGDEPLGQGVNAEFLFLHAADPIKDVTLTLEESITDDWLADQLATLPSRQQFVVIDACHSGGFLGSATSTDAVPQSYDGTGEGVSIFDAFETMSLYLSYGPAADVEERQAIVIAAAGEQEFSYEGAGFGYANGVFTHFFLESRFAGDANYDGWITASEAHAYATHAIAAGVNDRFYGDDKFLPRISGGAVDFVLFRAR